MIAFRGKRTGAKSLGDMCHLEGDAAASVRISLSIYFSGTFVM